MTREFDHSQEKEKHEKNCKCDACTKKKIQAYYFALIVVFILGVGVLSILFKLASSIIIPIPVPPAPLPEARFGTSLILTNNILQPYDARDGPIPLIFNSQTNIPVGQSLYAYLPGFNFNQAIIQTLRNVTTEYRFTINAQEEVTTGKIFFEFLTLSCPGFPINANGVPNPNCDISGISIPVKVVDFEIVPISFSTSARIITTPAKPQAFVVVSVLVLDGASAGFYEDLLFSAKCIASC